VASEFCFFALWGVTLCKSGALTLLVGRQEGHPACKKTERWVAGVVICLERCADLHTSQPLPITVSCFSKMQMALTYDAFCSEFKFRVNFDVCYIR